MKCRALVHQGLTCLVCQFLSSVVYKKAIWLLIISQPLENKSPLASGSAGFTFKTNPTKVQMHTYCRKMHVESQSQMKTYMWMCYKLKQIFELQFLRTNIFRIPVTRIRMSFVSVRSGVPSRLLNSPHFLSEIQTLKYKNNVLKFTLQNKLSVKGNRWSLIL